MHIRGVRQGRVINRRKDAHGTDVAIMEVIVRVVKNAVLKPVGLDS